MRSLLCVCALIALASSCVLAQDPKEYEYQVTVGGTQRTFYVYVPSTYTGQTAYPLVVFFHGATDSCSRATNFMISGFTVEQATRPYLLATPCGINHVWSPSIDVPFAEALLSTISADYKVGSAYSAGFSNGAFLTEYMGCYVPQLWAGLAIAAGTVNVNSSTSNAQILQDCDATFAKANVKLNIIKLQGAKDPAVQPYGATNLVSMRDDFYGWALRQGCKGSPTTVHEDQFYKAEQFQNCPTGISVRLVMAYGIPHEWVQNATLNYNQQILDQFGITARAAPLTSLPMKSRLHRKHH